MFAFCLSGTSRVAITFVGRKSELAKLDQFLGSPDSRIGVVYGRRRIGKSMLIRHALQDRAALMLDGLEGESTQRQIRYFMDQLQTLAGAKMPRVRSWESALRQLCSVASEDPRPIVLDEFQWMANHRRSLVSVLKSIWDNVLSLLPAQKLILCGSIASFMVENVIKSSALYGRVLMELEVRPFKLFDTKQMLAGLGVDEILQAQMLTGGIPQYLHLLSTAPSIQLGMQALAFQQDGYFVRDYDRIFTSHFGSNPDFAAS
jgi:AAA+ ATPase superfamily predicted ATPase